MSKQSIKTVNERTYIVNAFKGLEGWQHLPRLTKYVFPFIGYMFNQDKTDDEMVSQLVELLSGENAKEVQQIVIDLTNNIQVDGAKVDFDKEFAQNYDALLLLTVEVVKLNYFDSFQRLVTNLPQA